MSADLVAAIELLQEQRRTALADLARIENELQRAKLAIQDAIGGRPIRAAARPTRVSHIRSDGSIANAILTALAASEPSRVHQLVTLTGLSQATVQKTCVDLVRVGRLFRVRLHEFGRPAIYARTKEALGSNGHVDVPVAAADTDTAEGEAADELG